MMLYGSAHRGYEYPLIKFLVISESDIFGKEKKKRKKKWQIFSEYLSPTSPDWKKGSWCG